MGNNSLAPNEVEEIQKINNEDGPKAVNEISAVALRRSEGHNKGLRKPSEFGFHCNHISVQSGRKQYGNAADEAALRELHQVAVLRDAYIPRHYHDLLKKKTNSVRSLTFMKPKHDAMVVFDKLKERIVANGAHQNRALYDDTSSPIARLQSVIMCLTIAAHELRRIVALNICGANTHAELPHGEGDTPVIKPIGSNSYQNANGRGPTSDFVCQRKGHSICPVTEGTVWMCAECSTLV